MIGTVFDLMLLNLCDGFFLAGLAAGALLVRIIGGLDGLVLIVLLVFRTRLALFLSSVVVSVRSLVRTR